jgi:H+-translocating NAD(P) transhydrogenase subunit alpha
MEGQSGSALTVGVPRETAPGEHRVALTPDVVKRLTSKGVVVKIERGAGRGASHDDVAYEAAGARIVPDARGAYDADVVIKVQKPTSDEVAMLRRGATLIALLQPLTNHELVGDLAARGVTSFSMDAIPRTTRAQAMDVLSSQATAAGYKAVLLAASALPKFFPMLTTAAGSIVPAKVLIVGAGVAGLQAIATARRLGAVVEAYDTRPVVKEQVESLGAKFVDIPVDTSDVQTAGGYAKEVSAETLRRQQEVLAEHAIKSDVVITTAAVPGRPAPRLISRETVERMRPGSVIVDLAAETGGNVEVTKAGETVDVNGVQVIGQLNLPSTMAVHSSQMYAKNIQNLLDLLIKDARFAPDYEDEIVKGTVITRNGEVVHEMTRQRMADAGAPPPPVAEPAPTAPPAPSAEPPTSPPGAAVQVVELAPKVEARTGNGAMGIAATEPAHGADLVCPPGAIVANGAHDCPPDYPIKGNASSLIYHVPGGGSYERTVPEFCFAGEREAEAAGYRAAR